MKRLFITLALVALTGSSVRAQTLLWGRQFGTAGFDHAVALTPDTAGGVFLAGTTPGSLYRPNSGGGPDSHDAFLVALRRGGNRSLGPMGPIALNHRAGGRS